jgi:transcriptional regulator with GAF, ATPase, and Fis domain
VTAGNELNLQLPELNEAHPLSSLKGVERRHITDVLEQTQGRIKGPGGAAELLGMKPSTLYGALKRLGISAKDS